MEGRFSKKARILAILQLILAFLFLTLWFLNPYLQGLYSHRNEIFLAKTTLGDLELLSHLPDDQREEAKTKLLFYQERFSALPEAKKELIEAYLTQHQREVSKPFKAKLRDSLDNLFFGPPLMLQLWVLAAIVLSIGLLKEAPWVRSAAFFLPLLIFLLLLQFPFREKLPPSHTEKLYPTEERLKNFSGELLNNKESFERAFEAYLIENHTRDGNGTLEEATFNFNVALITAKRADQNRPIPKEGSPLFMLLFFGWNLFFAFQIQEKK